MWKLRGDTNRTIIGTGAATTMRNDTALRAARAVDGTSSHSNHNHRAREDRGAVKLELGQPNMHQDTKIPRYQQLLMFLGCSDTLSEKCR